MLQITVNGAPTTLEEGNKLDQALADMGHCGRHFAVAVNGEFVSRDRYTSFALGQGDAIEVLSPMQGG